MKHHQINKLPPLGWRQLAYRRADADLCMMYKIVNGLVRIPSNQYLVPVNIINRRQQSLPGADLGLLAGGLSQS